MAVFLLKRDICLYHADIPCLMGDVKKRVTPSPWQHSQHLEADEDVGNRLNRKEKVQSDVPLFIFSFVTYLVIFKLFKIRGIIRKACVYFPDVAVYLLAIVVMCFTRRHLWWGRGVCVYMRLKTAINKYLQRLVNIQPHVRLLSPLFVCTIHSLRLCILETVFSYSLRGNIQMWCFSFPYHRF